jgi:hypothetical protein
MSYFYILADQHMNYTLNRPLADGEAKGRIAERKHLRQRSRTSKRGPLRYLGLYEPETWCIHHDGPS